MQLITPLSEWAKTKKRNESFIAAIANRFEEQPTLHVDQAPHG